MLDKRMLGSAKCIDGMSDDDALDWFGYKQKKFLANIDTFYIEFKLKNDLRSGSDDASVLRMRRFFENARKHLDSFDGALDLGELSKGGLPKELVLTPKSFSRFYNICLTLPDMLDIFIAPVVPKSSDGGESVTPEIVAQVRSKFLWTFGAHVAVDNVRYYVDKICSYFGLEIDFAQENRVDYCTHTNYLKEPQKFFNPDNFHAMRVDRFKDTMFHTCKVGQNDFEYDYIALGKRSCKIFVRIYDKTKEVIEQHYKPWFFQVWYMEGLISAYDRYVYEKCYAKGNWSYRYMARLEWYIEYGSDVDMVRKCRSVVGGNEVLSFDSLVSLADDLTPDINLVWNIEFQVMRRASKSFELLPVHDNSMYGYMSRVYDILDNTKIIRDYLTMDTFRLVEKTGDDNKTRRECCAFWKCLRACRSLFYEMTDDGIKLTRTYERNLNIEAMKKRCLDSAVMLGVYQYGINDDDPYQDAYDALSVMNDNDIENARRYKAKKIRRLNAEDFAGLVGDSQRHDFCILDSRTGEVIDNYTLNSAYCQALNENGMCQVLGGKFLIFVKLCQKYSFLLVGFYPALINFPAIIAFETSKSSLKSFFVSISLYPSIRF